MRMWTELGVTGCIFGGCLILWASVAPQLLIWLLAIPGLVVWWIIARLCAWQLINLLEGRD